MIRTLTPNDRDLISEALGWTTIAPRWFQNGERVWGSTDVDDYLERMKTQVDYGVFENGLQAVITIARIGERRYTCHFMARPHANVSLIVDAGQQILARFREFGLREVTAWPMSKNRGVKRILEAIGFREDGISRIKGQSHGRLLEWLRYSA